MSQYAPRSEGLLTPIQSEFEDPTVSEILLNRPQEIYVERGGELKVKPVPELNEMLLSRLFQLIANENQQELSEKSPLLSGSLLDGSRVQLVLPPTSRYPTFSIRRKVVRHLKLEDYEKREKGEKSNESDFYHSVLPFDISGDQFEFLPDSEKELVVLYTQKKWPQLIARAIELKKNIVISGGTSSGKTTYLNACLRHIPLTERIITLEDTREIELEHPNCVQLLATKGEQGVSRITMQDLVQCSLRLRPDRIVMGEIRGKEIMDFVSACSTGHEGSLTTIHANNPRIAFMRMAQLYKQNNVPSMTEEDILNELKEVVDIVVQLNKTTTGRKMTSLYYKYGHLAKESIGKQEKQERQEKQENQEKREKKAA